MVSPLSPDLADRYGRPSRTRRPLVVGVAGLLGVTGLVWLAWVAVFHGNPQVTSQLVGFEVRGQHAAVATYTVVRQDQGVQASCLLRASAADHAVVGELSVPVRSGPTQVRMTSTVRTERRATTVDLVGCTASEQSRRR